MSQNINFPADEEPPLLPAAEPSKKRGRRKAKPKIIDLPNGETAVPYELLAEELGISRRTLQRMRVPTVYVGNVAHGLKNATLKMIAASARPRPR
jgi:hypothetical protein